MMQAGEEQPAHPVAPTVFRVLMPLEIAKYSRPADRSWPEPAGTAETSRMREVFGPRTPSWYAAMAGVARPPAQSLQLRAVAGGDAPGGRSDAERQEPAFLNCHHGGSGEAAVAMAVTSSRPGAPGRLAPSSKLVTSVFVPLFVLQAKLVFVRPASPKQFSHFRLTPGAADAMDAVSARSKPHSRVTFFIFLPPDLFTERGLGEKAL